ncbi:hypothetical protein TRFO_42223 [Tritrichomonas foetus]|uniref:Uncharacterized protein n=1 Tax=Tritrichomonas foetus TaxID=1144522 RepID=A0A1J4KXC1_9EUKA|nr:hypothetical protein TRFO_42223 [Tritrichomonas foetus]|eukprot:OHT15899.1 hypothetical protein TRFO_42223 [Tritrichomonas foetus]
MCSSSSTPTNNQNVIPIIKIFFPGELTNNCNIRNQIKTHVRQFCSHLLVKQSNSTYVLFICANKECSFSVSYSFRMKLEHGFYLITEKNYCHEHHNECPYLPYSNIPTKPHDFTIMLKELFSVKSPSYQEVEACLRVTFPNRSFTPHEIKYIRSDGITCFRGNALEAFSTIIDYANNTSQKWEVIPTLIDGFIDEVMILQPLGRKLIQLFPQPILTDATFTYENIKFIIVAIKDSENHIHPAAIN